MFNINSYETPNVYNIFIFFINNYLYKNLRMSVNLFDPQEALFNPKNGLYGINQTQIVNGVPNYEDMFIFVEFIAERRGRTVLETNGVGKTKIFETGLDKSIAVNMLGFNQDKTTTNNMHHTTNWYQGSVSENKTQYEGFGISNIKIVISSSFVPQISIEFIDIRGLSFFENHDSPYRILFDFPPPVFHLTIKGFYGKSATYPLHLVKNNTKFDAASGNFIINSEFVGMTFAPLADVLLQYMINFGVMKKMEKKINVNEEPSTGEPTTTYELIKKLRNLYDNDKLQLKINTTDESVAYNNAIDIKKAINLFFNTVPTFNTFNKIPSDYKTKGIIGNLDSDYNIITPSSLATYNEYLKNEGKGSSTTKLNNRLILAFSLYTIPTNQSNNSFIPKNFGSVDLENGLNAFGKNLISIAKKVIKSTDNLAPKNATTITTQLTPTFANNFMTGQTYIYLDISDLYFNIYENLAPTNKQIQESQTALKAKVDALIFQELKFQPTIYNIFKIFCSDIDIFFQKLRDTVVAAENHHNTYKDQIITDASGTYADNTKDIFAFPLCIKTDTNARTYPNYISDTLPVPFPELVLVNDFIDSFLQLKKDELITSLKTQNDDSGNSKWIPITPLDSTLGEVGSESPYSSLDPNGDGIIPVKVNAINQFFDILVRRYYILSQYSFGKNDVWGGKIFDDKIISFYAETEAINVANSVYNSSIINLLRENAGLYKSDSTVNLFYKYLNENLPNLYKLSGTTTNSTQILLEEPIFVYRDRFGSKFKGISIIPSENNPNEIEIRNESSDVVSDFIAGKKSTGFLSMITNFFAPAKIDPQMTKENVFLIPDNNVSENNYSSRYIVTFHQMFGLPTLKNKPRIRDDFNNLIGLQVGNNGLEFGGTPPIITNLGDPSISSSFSEDWSSVLAQIGSELLPTFTNGDDMSTKLSSLLYASNFGYTLSPFSHIRYINYNVFTKPAVITVPYYVIIYMGAIVEMIRNDSFLKVVENFFTKGAGSKLIGKGCLIFADYYDVLTYLSKNDQDTFLAEYNKFFTLDSAEGFASINSAVIDMINVVTSTKKNEKTSIIRDEYEKNLIGTYKVDITEKLTKPSNIVNYSNITFNSEFTDRNNPYFKYESIESQTTTNKKGINDKFFSQFFMFLENKMKARNDYVNNIEKDFKKSTGDEDLWSQVYYSFKNISDKWISGMANTIYGYPFNGDATKESGGLLSKFAFVDRAMNPIGHVMINPRDLTEKGGVDFDINIYSIMSEILTGNGFEFFPLSNFLKFSNDGWREAFIPRTNLENENNTAFVCMYMGGSSSYPNNLENGFIDDGITDMENDPTLNAPSRDTVDTTFDDQKATNPDFTWNQPVAFRVRFGEQNQSLFYDVQLDSKEFPETNESLQILSKIAGDNKEQSPAPKGQNLYNVYENRSYSAQVSMLGDVMIQPVQYFQLENIPMFSGAYMILGVEHNITPNYMTTSFKGTKILKYPVPLVTSAAAVFGIDVGTTELTSGETAESNSNTPAPNAANAPLQAQYNAMYTLPLAK